MAQRPATREKLDRFFNGRLTDQSGVGGRWKGLESGSHLQVMGGWTDVPSPPNASFIGAIRLKISKQSYIIEKEGIKQEEERKPRTQPARIWLDDQVREQQRLFHDCSAQFLC